jgi:hypothetical protein
MLREPVFLRASRLTWVTHDCVLESWHVLGQRLGTRIGAAHDGRQPFYALESNVRLYGSLALPSLAGPGQRSNNTSIVGDPSRND